MRALTATWLCVCALVRAADTCAANPAPYGSADAQYANFAFASEIGSGVYEISGSIITVYTFEPGYILRNAEPRGGRPGIRLIFPFTVGFFNFDTKDLLHLDLPSSIGALSFEPGVELDYWLTDAWHLYPYLKVGGTLASSAEVSAIIYGTGVRSDYRFYVLRSADLWRSELNYAAAHYHDTPSQSFTRLRNGVELRWNFDLNARSHDAQVAPYAITDIYFNAPAGANSGISPRTFQYEVGLMFGPDPPWQIYGISLPRLGFGYREAGVLSGWRLVLGDPF